MTTVQRQLNQVQRQLEASTREALYNDVYYGLGKCSLHTGRSAAQPTPDFCPTNHVHHLVSVTQYYPLYIKECIADSHILLAPS